ncbi:MAG: DUF1249 domain-containing protein [Gammaproteobacteria bacterium]|nr:DUF1249 domain-containing protein [Gammaproteobacteria bacterium]
MQAILDDSDLARFAPRNRLDRLMREYERNYERIRLLVPGLRRLRGRCVSRAPAMPDLHIEVLEQSAYTTTLVMNYALEIDGSRLPEPEVQVRVYHDARMAEVLAVREPGPTGGRAWCSLRHSAMSRKWRFNRFLAKWLAYCLQQGHGRFESPAAAGAPA